MYREATATLPGFVAAAPRSQEAPSPALLLPARRWGQWAGLAITLVMLAVLAGQLRDLDLRHMWGLLPRSAAFGLVFAFYYFAPVGFEWIIFRRLWRIPPGGLVALTRKYIGNEILLGYAGEVDFYLWARRHSEMSGAPFGAIKDVAILSAAVGNAVTLVMMAAAFPLLGELTVSLGGKLLYLSALVIILSSLAILLLRRRLFALSTPNLRFVAFVHLLRILTMMGLAALTWHIILPDVALGWWVLLAALRLVLSRLPFLPNKDLAFAGLATLAVGHDAGVSAMLALIASLLLAPHVVLGLGIMLPQFVRQVEPAPQ